MQPACHGRGRRTGDNPPNQGSTRGCHILVNNADVTSAGTFEDESIEGLAWITDINVWGVVHGCGSLLPVLRKQDEAHIGNLSSMVGLLGLPYNVSSSLTKGAVRSFTEALRSELITRTARGSDSAIISSMGTSRFAPLVMRPPSTAANRIVHAIERNRARVVIGPDARSLDIFSRIIPGRSGILGRALSRARARHHGR